MKTSVKVIDESGLERTKFQEDNRKSFKEYHEANKKKVLSETAEHAQIEEIDKVTDFKRPDFSIKKFREASYALSKRLREAQSELTFGQLTRAGVLNVFNDIYQSVEVTYDAVVRQTQSNKRAEFHSPLERVGFPKKVLHGENYPESDFKGLDIELINEKFGLLMSVERELIDDDMTGQILERAGQLGENCRIHEEALVWGKISGATGLSFDGEAIDVSQTYSTVYTNGVPGSSGGIHGSGRGVNALGGSGFAAGRISQAVLQSGWFLSKLMKDQSGRPMTVLPNILATSVLDEFFVKTLLNSEYNPSKASTASAEDGNLGGNFSINPVKNLVGVVSTRFLPNYAALLIQAGKGFAFQRRDPTEVYQENPQSGPAFSQDVFRYKVRTRWAADFIDPKFMINLNPSLASS